MVLVCVDDVLVTGSSVDLITKTKYNLRTHVEMMNSDKCRFVLVIELLEGPDVSSTMCQRCCVDNILMIFGMNECMATITPVDLSSHLVPTKK